MAIARLALENGQIYTGRVFAKGKDCFGEVIFNTSLCGYEEVLSDPSYKGQIVVLTYPLIGNYGINEEDKQSSTLHLQALIIKEYSPYPSNWRSKKNLKDYLEEHNILGIEGLDTRTLTRTLRYAGALKGYLTTSQETETALIQKVRSSESIEGKNLAQLVSTKTPYQWKMPPQVRYKVAVVDCGVKYNILDQLYYQGCAVTCFPYNVSPETLLNGEFDGVLISNGPGNPEAVKETINTAKAILGKIPLFGICLGHQILCCAVGIQIYKLPFGHHGINHPVKNLLTEKIEITSQNHIYCASQENLPIDWEVTHINLNDMTVAGIQNEKFRAFSVQYHPEAAPGPSDSYYLFSKFCQMMDKKFPSVSRLAMSVA